MISTDKIQTAGDQIKQLRPAYGQLIDFYVPIFKAQQDSLATLQLDPLTIDDALLTAERENGLPLIQISQFHYDPGHAATLLERICQIVIQLGPKELGVTADTLAAFNQMDIRPVINAMLSGQDGQFNQFAAQMHIEGKILSLLIYSCLAPAIETGAQQVAAAYLKGAEHPKGYCPVCGCPPALSLLDADNGRRWLYCSFCRHQWPVQRIFCAACENDDNHSLQYFYTETEKEYRVDLCDKCQTYLKNVDAREMIRPLFPPLEQVATLHLDLSAQEKGYQCTADKFGA